MSTLLKEGTLKQMKSRTTNVTRSNSAVQNLKANSDPNFVFFVERIIELAYELEKQRSDS